MEIFACLRCGSRNIHSGTISDGVLDGYAVMYVCRDCGYQGMPMLFDSMREYERFLQSFKKSKKD
jgi:transcription elongation factor Elf1